MNILCLLSLLFPCVLRADLNGDGRVDFSDLAIFASEWMQEEEGRMAGYLEFGGIFPRVVVADDPSLNFGTGNFSISFWVKTNSIGSGQGLVAKDPFRYGLGFGIILNKSGNVVFDMKDSDSKSIILTGNSSLEANKWYHVVCSTDRNGDVSIYVNGSFDSSAACPLTGSINTVSNLYIGNTSEITARLDGFFDSLRLYKKCLSPTEVVAIYTAGRTNPYSAVVGEGGTASAVFEFDVDKGNKTKSTVLTTEADLTGTFYNDVQWIDESQEQIESPVVNIRLGPELVKNGDFKSAQGWSYGLYWNIDVSSGKAIYNKPAGEINTVLQKPIDLLPDTDYLFGARISNLSIPDQTVNEGVLINIPVGYQPPFLIYRDGYYFKMARTPLSFGGSVDQEIFISSSLPSNKAVSFEITDITVRQVFYIQEEDVSVIETLKHTPAMILAEYVINKLSLGDYPEDSGLWPVYISFLPDDVIGISFYDTVGTDDGRLMSGVSVIHPGVQIRIRSHDYESGWIKCQNIKEQLDILRNKSIEIDSSEYLIQAVNCGMINSLGIEPNTKRKYMFTLNVMLTVKERIET
jgi:hypothetical protein